MVLVLHVHLKQNGSHNVLGHFSVKHLCIGSTWCGAMPVHHSLRIEAARREVCCVCFSERQALCKSAEVARVLHDILGQGGDARGSEE